ncbi:YtpR family tRNA-binding protein [Halalkalibacterium halodurans]|jgi:tRNA-binding protein|uniref:YtpR family tRNA-binding protein n=1 Tax=Halalkalibacterium halodurans TaxID=86665 RepID=UPI0010FE7C63|nr:DUF4479 family protein [Halalkalibacterium halodurans]
MNVFYNEKGIGDTILIVIDEVEPANRAYERQGDVVRIYHLATGKTTGYNLFHASKYGEFNGQGLLELTDSLVATLEQAFQKNGVNWTLEVDLSPKFVVGFVQSKDKHPNADKLSICKVDVGSDTLQIVCGAPNVEAGQKVVVALEGAVMPSGLVIKPTSLRGVSSTGMICSAKELALPDAPEEKGILVLDDSYEVGTSFF